MAVTDQLLGETSGDPGAESLDAFTEEMLELRYADNEEFTKRMRHGTQEQRNAVMRAMAAESRQRLEESRQRSREAWEAMTPEERERQEAKAEAIRKKVDAETRFPPLSPEDLEEMAPEEVREYRIAQARERIRLVRREVERRRAEADEARRDSSASDPDLTVIPDRFIDQWQFRSIMTIGAEPVFSLHNPWEQSSFWAGVGEARGGIRVAGFDPETNTVRIEHESGSKELALAGSRQAGAEVAPRSHRDYHRDPGLFRQDYTGFYQTWQRLAQESPEFRDLDAEIREMAEAYADSWERYMSFRGRMNPDVLRIRDEIMEERLEIHEQARRFADDLEGRLQEHSAFNTADFPTGNILSAFILTRGKE